MLVPAVVTFALFKKKTAKIALMSFPLLWLLGELSGSVFYSILMLGEGTGLSYDFSTGYLGYLFGEHGLLVKLASLGGVFILSLVLAGLVALVYYLQSQRKKTWLPTIIILCFATSFISYHNPHINEDVSIIALETNYEAYTRLDEAERRVRQDNLLKTISEALQSSPEYIVLPEDARMSSVFASNEAVFNFLETFATEDVVLVDSLPAVSEEGNNHVAAKIYDTSDDSVHHIYKEMLMPTGEYLPYFHQAVLRLLGYGEVVNRHTRMYGFQPRENEGTVPDGIPYVLFCFESISSTALKEAAERSGADFVVHPVSHSWFGNPWLLNHQLDQMFRVNTLFAKTTVYQATNRGEAKRF
jgi:apolipoprotein N-acyltransferase